MVGIPRRYSRMNPLSNVGLLDVRRRRRRWLQARIDRLALQGEHAEDTLVHAPQRFPAARIARVPRSPTRTLSQRQRALPRQTSLAQPLEMFRQRARARHDILGLAAAAFHGRLQKPASVRRHEGVRLDHGALAALIRQTFPPAGGHGLAGGIAEIDHAETASAFSASSSSSLDEARDGVHVPEMILVHVNGAFGGHHVKRGDPDRAMTRRASSSCGTPV